MPTADANTGLTPETWREKLDKASDDPKALAELLAALEAEMRSERSFLHSNPSPDGLLKSVIGFLLDDKDDDYERLAGRLKGELNKECRLLEWYRTWKPDEDPEDRLFLFLKDFGGKIERDQGGAQFDGFSKFQGSYDAPEYNESYIFYLNERFPGRDPANFHVQFIKKTGAIVIKRVYRMELPRQRGRSAAREVLAELIMELTPTLSQVTEFDVDNAANIQTRQALMGQPKADEKGAFELKRSIDVAATPLGNLMSKLAGELGLKQSRFVAHCMPYGMLRIEMFIEKN